MIRRQATRREVARETLLSCSSINKTNTFYNKKSIFVLSLSSDLFINTMLYVVIILCTLYALCGVSENNKKSLKSTDVVSNQ